MTTIGTNLRNTKDGANYLRFRPVAPLTSTDVQDAINELGQFSNEGAGTAVTAAMSPYAVQPTDRVLLVDTTGGPVQINMMSGGARQTDVTVKDDKEHAATNNITVTFVAGETADGLSPYLIDSDGGAARFKPQAGGYYVDA